MIKPAHLASIAFHNRVAHGHLAVATDDDQIVTAYRKDGGTVILLQDMDSFEIFRQKRRRFYTKSRPETGSGLPAFTRLMALAGARMGLVIDLGKMLEIQVGINLCRRDIRVTEQFLHCTQITTGFQQVAGKGMA